MRRMTRPGMMNISGVAAFNSSIYDNGLIKYHEDNSSDSDGSIDSNLSLSKKIKSDQKVVQDSRSAQLEEVAQEVTKSLELTFYRLFTKMTGFINATEEFLCDNYLAIAKEKVLEMALLTDTTRLDLATFTEDFQNIIEAYKNSVAVQSTSTIVNQKAPNNVTTTTQKSSTKKSTDLSKMSNTQTISQEQPTCSDELESEIEEPNPKRGSKIKILSDVSDDDSVDTTQFRNSLNKVTSITQKSNTKKSRDLCKMSNIQKNSLDNGQLINKANLNELDSEMEEPNQVRVRNQPPIHGDVNSYNFELEKRYQTRGSKNKILSHAPDSDITQSKNELKETRASRSDIKKTKPVADRLKRREYCRLSLPVNFTNKLVQSKVKTDKDKRKSISKVPKESKKTGGRRKTFNPKASTESDDLCKTTDQDSSCSEAFPESDTATKTPTRRLQQQEKAPCTSPTSRKRSLYSADYWTALFESSNRFNKDEPPEQKLKLFS